MFSWIGIIMYIPANASLDEKAKIRRNFEQYCLLIEPLLQEYGAQVHWAKVELPLSGSSSHAVLEASRSRIRAKYPLDKFNEIRGVLDRNSILSNEIIDKLLNK